jgi:uncharacterized integral membrane protein (TIGR00698 family)
MNFPSVTATYPAVTYPAAANPAAATHTSAAGPRAPVVPGVALCLLVAAGAVLLAMAEQRLLGRAWLEPLVLAILLGTAVRTAWNPGARWHAGIAFSARYLLEAAVVMLGASVTGAALQTAGPALLIGIAVVVALSISLSFALSRALGLPTRLSLLVACGNSICGNSAIAAVAPVIGADARDVAAAIAFTAVLGVGVVLGLPLLGIVLGMNAPAYGTFAGLTVYAVPQVLAAASPFGAAAVQIGTLVKLIRVLMLGPVCLILSLWAPRLLPRLTGQTTSSRPTLAHMVPWFIIGFVALAACRSLGVLPPAAVVPLDKAATALTVVSMAALGLGVDIRTVAAAGGRVTAAVVLSLLALSALSLLLVMLLQRA